MLNKTIFFKKHVVTPDFWTIHVYGTTISHDVSRVFDFFFSPEGQIYTFLHQNVFPLIMLFFFFLSLVRYIFKAAENREGSSTKETSRGSGECGRKKNKKWDFLHLVASFHIESVLLLLLFLELSKDKITIFFFSENAAATINWRHFASCLLLLYSLQFICYR